MWDYFLTKHQIDYGFYKNYPLTNDNMLFTANKQHHSFVLDEIICMLDFNLRCISKGPNVPGFYYKKYVNRWEIYERSRIDRFS